MGWDKWEGLDKWATMALISIGAHPDGRECAKDATTLHYGFPDATHQLPTPHSNPERKKSTQEHPSCHAHCIAHHKTHLYVAEAA